MKTKSQVNSANSTYSFAFLSIFLGSLLIPLMTVSAGLTGLLDGFRGKARFITAYTETRLMLGDQVFNRTLVGTDGWLYLTAGESLTDYQRVPPFSPAQLNKIRQVLEKFQRRVQADGTEFLFVIPPDKSTIYPEHIPFVISQTAKPSRLDQLTTYLVENSSPLHFLDLRPTLLEAGDTYPLYYATDSHWTPMGAFFAYQKIIEALQLSFPELSYHSLSDYKIVNYDPTPLDMPTIIGSTSLAEASFALAPIHQPGAVTMSIDTPSPDGPRQLYFSHTNDQNAPTALIFDDSFITALQPFLAEHFSSAVYINYFAVPNISSLTWYEQFHPDIVIFEMTERNLATILGPDFLKVEQ